MENNNSSVIVKCAAMDGSLPWNNHHRPIPLINHRSFTPGGWMDVGGGWWLFRRGVAVSLFKSTDYCKSPECSDHPIKSYHHHHPCNMHQLKYIDRCKIVIIHHNTMLLHLRHLPHRKVKLWPMDLMRVMISEDGERDAQYCCRHAFHIKTTSNFFSFFCC